MELEESQTSQVTGVLGRVHGADKFLYVDIIENHIIAVEMHAHLIRP